MTAVTMPQAPPAPTQDLAGRTVVVLGGSSGIGLETARLARSSGGRRTANIRAGKGGAPASELRAKRVRNHIARSSQRKIRGVGEQRRSLLGSNGNAEKKALGLDGTDPAYEQWLRANNSQQPPQSD